MSTDVPPPPAPPDPPGQKSSAWCRYLIRESAVPNGLVRLGSSRHRKSMTECEKFSPRAGPYLLCTCSQLIMCGHEAHGGSRELSARCIVMRTCLRRGVLERAPSNLVKACNRPSHASQGRHCVPRKGSGPHLEILGASPWVISCAAAHAAAQTTSPRLSPPPRCAASVTLRSTSLL